MRCDYGMEAKDVKKIGEKHNIEVRIFETPKEYAIGREITAGIWHDFIPPKSCNIFIREDAKPLYEDYIHEIGHCISKSGGLSNESELNAIVKFCDKNYNYFGNSKRICAILSRQATSFLKEMKAEEFERETLGKYSPTATKEDLEEIMKKNIRWQPRLESPQYTIYDFVCGKLGSWKCRKEPKTEGCEAEEFTPDEIKSFSKDISENADSNFDELLAKSLKPLINEYGFLRSLVMRRRGLDRKRATEWLNDFCNVEFSIGHHPTKNLKEII